MRQSTLFGKTKKEQPAGETAKNAILLEQAGFTYKTMAGVYDYLPLGQRVIANISKIIREEMNHIGGAEMFLSALQPKERWQKTGRWKKLHDTMYQFSDNTDREIGLGATHEEAIAEIARHSIQSYRDIPLSVYQIQTKFRDEPRAKSGLMRGREFLMKDLYSFHPTKDDLHTFYWNVGTAYETIFSRCGLDAIVTEAGGGTFTDDITHEYQVLSEAGEDTIFYCAACRFSQNKEITEMQDGSPCPKCSARITQAKSIEVGNIFRLGTFFAEAFNVFYTDKQGKKHPVWMGSYGIGLGRLMATVVEVYNDNSGILWPHAVAPFSVHLIDIAGKQHDDSSDAATIYRALQDAGISVLFDDRPDKTPGEKFADADLIGIPIRIVASKKTLEKDAVEIKQRAEKTSTIIPLKDLRAFITQEITSYQS